MDEIHVRCEGTSLPAYHPVQGPPSLDPSPKLTRAAVTATTTPPTGLLRSKLLPRHTVATSAPGPMPHSGAAASTTKPMPMCGAAALITEPKLLCRAAATAGEPMTKRAAATATPGLLLLQRNAIRWSDNTVCAVTQTENEKKTRCDTMGKHRKVCRHPKRKRKENDM